MVLSGLSELRDHWFPKSETNALSNRLSLLCLGCLAVYVSYYCMFESSGQSMMSIPSPPAHLGTSQKVDFDYASLERNFSFGSKNGQIRIIEFGDFQCPFCGKGNKTSNALLRLYDGQVALYFVNCPLNIHPSARSAAKAAVAASLQGKFWEFRNELYERQGALSEDEYIAIARKLGLDIQRFRTDLNSKRVTDFLEKDLALASKLGIVGTPRYYINGVPIIGALPIEKFQEVIAMQGNVKKQ